MSELNNESESIISNTILNNKPFLNNILLELFNPILLKMRPYLILFFSLHFIILLLMITILYKINKLK